VRFGFELLELLAGGCDLLFERGDVPDLGQPVVQEFFGARPLILGPLLGAAVLIALPFELGHGQ
jgi:hypothetical protein